MAMNRQDDRVESAERGRRAKFSQSSSSILRRNLLSRYSSSQIVAMMKTTESWHRNNFTSGSRVTSCLMTGRSFLGQRKMSSVLVVVPDVLAHQAF